MHPAKPASYQYRICVEGHINTDWVDWPCAVEVHNTFDPSGRRAITLLSSLIPDSPALYSLLEKLRDLNLTLIYAQREEERMKTKNEQGKQFYKGKEYDERQQENE